ncbi:SDR family oxidoreductase [Burkholderia sp. Ac-20353]|uniref:SDR family NAD(P)-dependent oxidoreductase n=1 Tax=Burkholderia sp. Ac-20353 TaxID=2703894 RepID=UPI00197BA5CE|nr:SDR family oxidoreductase [Burkholderia sp. Ac-20353]MBN3787312.1 SDR family oxidoreductase [Burkholderia sp. Ac-20353]
MDERIVLITGAATGIGAATALRLAGKYQGLVLHTRKSREQLDGIADAVASKGTKVVTVLGDLTDEALASRLVGAAATEFGRLDGIVANAGFPVMKSFDEGSFADLDYAFRGNVYSFFSLARAAAPYLMHSPAARMVAIGSINAHVFRTDLFQAPLSAASKGALETAVRSLALHFGKAGITVNCVVPGFVHKDAGTEHRLTDEQMAETEARIPLRRAGQPRDVAAAIEFLLSRDAGYITGQSLHVNGGLV